MNMNERREEGKKIKNTQCIAESKGTDKYYTTLEHS